MQENNETITTQRKRGRPPKESVQSSTQLKVIPVDNGELEQLKSQLRQVIEERDKLKQIAETISVTNTKNLVECTDDEINSLYVDYITHHEIANANAVIIQVADKIIIPKSYYVIG